MTRGLAHKAVAAAVGGVVTPLLLSPQAPSSCSRRSRKCQCARRVPCALSGWRNHATAEYCRSDCESAAWMGERHIGVSVFLLALPHLLWRLEKSGDVDVSLATLFTFYSTAGERSQAQR